MLYYNIWNYNYKFNIIFIILYINEKNKYDRV